MQKDRSEGPSIETIPSVLRKDPAERTRFDESGSIVQSKTDLKGVRYIEKNESCLSKVGLFLEKFVLLMHSLDCPC